VRDSLGLDFLNRTLKTTGLLLLIFLPFGVYYLGVYPALAVFSGGVWGIVNFIFLAALIRAAFRPDGVDRRRLLGLALVKFPMLYGAAYCLLTVPEFTPPRFLIGFSVVLAVMVLKVLGRLLPGLHDENPEPKRLERAL